MPKGVFKKISNKTEETEFYLNVPKNYLRGKTKYVVITGSVISGVGKGTFSSCLGSMLQMYHGLNVVPLKFECYVNYDSGTLNPFRHGEVFVLDDGTETDLDLGTYERMLNKNLTRSSFVTMGKVFKTIIDKGCRVHTTCHRGGKELREETSSGVGSRYSAHRDRRNRRGDTELALSGGHEGTCV